MHEIFFYVKSILKFVFENLLTFDVPLSRNETIFYFFILLKGMKQFYTIAMNIWYKSSYKFLYEFSMWHFSDIP